MANSPCCDMPIPSDCCDVSTGVDCNNNLVKDSCDLAYKVSIDCNANNVPDMCDVENGTPEVDTTYEEYLYDALGRRIAKRTNKCTGSTEETRYYYAGENVILETDVANTPQRSFVHGNQYIDEHILMRDENQNIDFYYLERENHTVAGLAVSTGWIAESYDYYAYGSVKVYDAYRDKVDPVEGSQWGNPYFFTGRRLDVVADRGLNQGFRVSNLPLAWPRQLYHYRARTMDPIHGRFMQRDPAGYVDGMNLYEYVSGNPLTFTDPTGKWKWEGGKRDSSKPRAIVIAEPGDSPKTLAKMIKLDAAEFQKWMKPEPEEGGPMMPQSSTSGVLDGCRFSVPNVAAIYWGNLNRGESYHAPISIFRLISDGLKEGRSYFRHNGFHVVEVLSPTANIMSTMLRDPDLYVFYYGGHGGGDGSLAPELISQNGNRVPRVPEMKYRTGDLHKIAALVLLSCYSADSSKAAAEANLSTLATWQKNVSKDGFFYGFLGERNFWDFEVYIEGNTKPW